MKYHHYKLVWFCWIWLSLQYWLLLRYCVGVGCLCFVGRHNVGKQITFILLIAIHIHSFTVHLLLFLLVVKHFRYKLCKQFVIFKSSDKATNVNGPTFRSFLFHIGSLNTGANCRDAHWCCPFQRLGTIFWLFKHSLPSVHALSPDKFQQLKFRCTRKSQNTLHRLWKEDWSWILQFVITDR